MEEYSNNSNNLLYYDKKELDDYIRESELNDSFNSGKSEGLSQGKKENSIETAKKMLADGISLDTISKYSGLSKEEILKLKNNN